MSKIKLTLIKKTEDAFHAVLVICFGVIALYKRIRDLREDKDLTQKQMGEILSCSQRVYSNYERGELDIPTEILIKLADFHEVSVDYILNRTDVKETKFL